MSKASLYADFNNADPRGCLRLNAIGTIEDLSRQGSRLEEGLQVVLHDEELEADGEIQRCPDEQAWVARIDWKRIRSKSA